MKKRILITGAKGFLGRNLIANLREQGFEEIYEYDLDTGENMLDFFCESCEFVYHLAGVNRPEHKEEYFTGNYVFTDLVLRKLKKYNNRSTIMYASSIQAKISNPYGESKKAGEELLKKFSLENGNKICIFQFPNLFGKWCKPDYNSVVATFCHNLARNLDIKVKDPNTEIRLVYIDDAVNTMISLLTKEESELTQIYYQVPEFYDTTVGNIADIISAFKTLRKNSEIPFLASDSLEKKLYSTYVSYLPEDDFTSVLPMHVDERGSFTEIFRTPERGQISVNISLPGIEKGNHWHNTKCEKFCVVSGEGLIRLKKPKESNIISYHVSGERLEMVDIPCGYAHSIINIGEEKLVTLMWCNECFDPEHADTYFLKVGEE